MTKIIQTESGEKLRKDILKTIGLTLELLTVKSSFDSETKDMVAFVVLALEKVAVTINESVAAWEKRGYWIKADHFRLEWDWAGEFAKQIKICLQENDWTGMQNILARIQTKGIISSKSLRINGKPWKGAYFKLYRKK